MDLARLLPESLIAQLGEAPAEVREAVRQIASGEPTTLVRGLDGLDATLLVRGRLSAQAPAAIPYALAFAGVPSFRPATAVLLRIARTIAAIDDPPRALAGSDGSPEARALYARVEPEVPRLVRSAVASGDPARVRLAACLGARFPMHDPEVEPPLVALLSGTNDEDERGRLLYALTRIRGARGATPHRAAAEALEASPTDPIRFAVLLALAEHDPPEPIFSWCANALRLAVHEDGSDPTGFGRQLTGRRALRTLERLLARGPSEKRSG
ncbi:MAG: hypothetical protein AB7P00_03480 [Sandaracinaceae bacterium]